MSLLIHIPSMSQAIAPSDYGDLTHRQQKEVRLAMASHPEAPVACLEKLSTNVNFDVRKTVALNQNTPVRLLGEMGTKCGKIRKLIAQHNPNAPEEFLEEYCDRNNQQEQIEAAKDSNCSTKFLCMLAANVKYCEELAKAIVEHPNCDTRVLEILADADWKINLLILNNPECPADLIVQFAKRKTKGYSEYAHARIAKHPNCPQDLLLSMVSWYNSIAIVALKNANCTQEMLDKAINQKYSKRFEYVKIAETLATHPKIDAYQLASLAQNPEPEIQALVAANPATPNEILVDLASSEHAKVRDAVIDNPNAAEDIVRLVHAYS